jgi:protein involved in polysaccharide export with SLBB domain
MAAVLVLVVLAVPCMATEPTGVQIVPPDHLPPVVDGPYEVTVGDVLNVDFFKAVEMSQTRTVGPDGEIFLSLIGRVGVMGRTVEDITREIIERYSVEMVNPQITVSVSEFSGLRVYVAGEVRSPGIREYRGGVTLVQAIFDAGGFTERARRNQVLVIRRGPNDEPFGSIVDVKQILRKGQLTHDLQLAPLDTVYVHWKKIVNVNYFVDFYISRNLPRFGEWLYWIPAYRNLNE